MAKRAKPLAELVAAQPGVAEVFAPDYVAACFNGAAEESQRAWSLLYYALWHSHHILGVAAEGDIGEVLASARP